MPRVCLPPLYRIPTYSAANHCANSTLATRSKAKLTFLRPFPRCLDILPFLPVRASHRPPLSQPPPLQSFSAGHRNSNGSHGRPPAPPPPLPAEHGSRAVPPPPPPRTTAASSGGGGSSRDGGKKPEPALGGFLGSLMGSMSQTHKSVAGAAAGEDSGSGGSAIGVVV